MFTHVSRNSTSIVPSPTDVSRVSSLRTQSVARLPLLALVLLVAGFLGLGLAEAWSDAPTFDEPVYVAAGIAGVLHHDVTFNDEHPPLPKVLAALPVLLTHPVIPPNGRWSGNDEQSYASRFVAAQLAAGTLRRVTFASRLVPLAESAGVAFVLFALGAELFGPGAGALAGALWLAAPFVLGIGHLDGVDIPFSLTTALSGWALARWLRSRHTRGLIWVGLALGAVAITQISGLLIVAGSLAVILAVEWRAGIERRDEFYHQRGELPLAVGGHLILAYAAGVDSTAPSTTLVICPIWPASAASPGSVIATTAGPMDTRAVRIASSPASQEECDG